MTDRRSLVSRDWTSFIGTRSRVHPLSRCIHIYIYMYIYIRTRSDSSRLFCIDLPVSSGYLDSITVNVIWRLSASALVHRWKTVPHSRRRTHLIIIRITVTYCVPLHMAMYTSERSLSIILKHIHIIYEHDYHKVLFSGFLHVSKFSNFYYTILITHTHTHTHWIILILKIKKINE